MRTFNPDKDNTLFLFIDFQEKLMPAMYENAKVIDVSKKAYEFSKLAGVESLFTTQYRRGLGGLVDEFRDEDEKALDKTEFSCYLNPEIKKVIDNLNKKNIVLFGQEAHICAFQTGRDLLEAGYNVFVVEEAMTSRTPENKKNGVELLRDMGAYIINFELLVFDILKDAKHSCFKEAQALIK